jgi:hypothetical protein
VTGSVWWAATLIVLQKGSSVASFDLLQKAGLRGVSGDGESGAFGNEKQYRLRTRTDNHVMRTVSFLVEAKEMDTLTFVTAMSHILSLLLLNMAGHRHLCEYS